MTARLPCPSAPGPLEAYAAQFDTLFHSLAQRRSFREYLTGLLLPRDRNKTLTALAGAEPVVQAQAPAVQRLQFFLSEAAWDVDAINAQRLSLLIDRPTTTPHAEGVWVLDDTGDRKDGTATAHVARQYLGSVGKIDKGIVAVTTLWADDRRYWPLHVEPYTPATRLSEGKRDARFRTKPQIALALIERAQAAHSFEEAIGELPHQAWHAVTRTFRDRHSEVWWAAELTLLGYGPDRPRRAIVATTDPRTLPPLTTWYLSTNLPVADAPLAEIVRLYGLRNWVEDSYKRMKDELGWADFMVRSDPAIRRHWVLVYCAFSFCWWHEARTDADTTPPSQPTRQMPGEAREEISMLLPPPGCWPQALRHVRAWLAPWRWLTRCWQAWSRHPPPPELAALLAAVTLGQGLHLYLPN